MYCIVYAKFGKRFYPLDEKARRVANLINALAFWGLNAERDAEVWAGQLRRENMEVKVKSFKDSSTYNDAIIE